MCFRPETSLFAMFRMCWSRSLRCFACVRAEKPFFYPCPQDDDVHVATLRASGQNIHVGTMMTSMLPARIQESASTHQRVWPFFAKDNPHGHAGWPKIARKPWSQHGLEGHDSLQGEAEGYAWLSTRGFLGSCCEGSRLAVLRKESAPSSQTHAPCPVLGLNV